MPNERKWRSWYQTSICTFASKTNITKGIKLKNLDFSDSCIWPEEHGIPPFDATVQIVKAGIYSWKCLLTTDVGRYRCQSIGLSNIFNSELKVRHCYESIDCSHLVSGLSDFWGTTNCICWAQLIWTGCWTRSGTRLISANEVTSISI